MRARWLVLGLLLAASIPGAVAYEPPAAPSADLLEYLGAFEPATGRSFDVTELVELFGVTGKTAPKTSKETKTATKKKEGGYE